MQGREDDESSRLARTEERRSRLAVAGLVVLFVPFFCARSFLHDMPIGEGGLFALMAETIADNGFAFPISIPHYGTGEVPFAYPPLSFYLMAAVTELGGVAPLDYMRLAPPLILAACLLPMFLLTRELSGSVNEAVVATSLWAVASVTTDYHSVAAGTCRAVALFNMFVALLFAQRAFAVPIARHVALAAIFFALTLLSHLSYAVFIVISVAAFSLRQPRRVGTAATILIGGFLLSMPWWLSVIHIHGIEVFERAMHTHDTLGFVGYLTHPSSLISLLGSVFFQNGSAVGRGAALLGVAVHAATGAWFLPTWLWMTAIGTGVEGGRFTIIVSAMLAAATIRFVYEYVQTQTRGPFQRYAGAVFLLILFLCCYPTAFLRSLQFAPSVERSTIVTANWIRENTPTHLKFLYLSDNMAEVEMMPYFLRRTAAVSTFGAEWSAGYAEQGRRLVAINDCVRLQSLPCLDPYLSTVGADLLISRSDLRPGSLNAQLAVAPSWRRIYEQDGWIVWRRVAL